MVGGSCSLATELASRVATSTMMPAWLERLHGCTYHCVNCRTRRTWKPNVQNKRLYSEILDEMVPLRVTTYALRCVLT